jgi:hypothetical protein
MREFIRQHPTRKRRTRALLEILLRRGPEAFHAFSCTLLSLKRDDLVKVLTNPDTEDMEMCFPEQLSFHLVGNLYLIAEQDGVWVGKHLHQIVSLQGQQSTGKSMESFWTSPE